ncbi:MAG: hypothetical protein P8Y18_06995 [Candidatus Bathyarchaeota archaeon]
MTKPPPYNNPHAAKAKVRAQKYLKALFKDDTYTAIMNSLEPNLKPNDFRKACSDAGLTTEETDWLWNYLKNCKKALWTNDKVRDDPPLANAGW